MADETNGTTNEEQPKIERTKFKSIKSRVSIHDRSQVETIFSYGLRGRESAGNPYYRVDAFVFLPVQSNINPDTYSKNQFFNDLRALVRLREPKLTFKTMVGERGDESPILKIQEILEGEEEKDFPPDKVSEMIEEARMYGCAYVSYFWRRIDRRVTRIRAVNASDKEETQERLEKSILDLCDKGYRMLRFLRDLRGNYKDRLEKSTPELRQEIDLVNEYCSYCFRDGLLRMLTELQKIPDYQERFPEGVHCIKKFLRFNRWYARQAGFYWVSDSSETGNQEEYIYRRGALKRRISSVLYLDPRGDFFFNLRKQFGPMIAAGLAAGWALFATLLLFKASDFQGYQFLNALSMTSILFVTTVYIVSYILKDRIKESMRKLFERGFVGQRPDLTSNIYYSGKSDKPLKIGVVKESFQFLKNNRVPSDIMALRLVHNDRAVDLDELATSPLHYTKHIRLNTNVLKYLDTPVNAVHDIIRLNIESYLLRLDDPLHRGLAQSKDGRAVEVLMPKVYHMDLILKYSPLRNTQKSIGVVYDYYRLVVTKRGLTRIEQLK